LSSTGVKARRHPCERTYDCGVVEPKVRGELGYADWCLILVAAGRARATGAAATWSTGRTFVGALT
jgi:hypothetical protein